MIYVGIIGILVFYVDIDAGAGTIWFGVTGDSSILSVLGAHVMLNLNTEAEKSLQQGSGSRTKFTISDVEFAPPSSTDAIRSLDEFSPDTTDRPREAEIEEITV